jgi:hypothetical protein
MKLRYVQYLKVSFKRCRYSFCFCIKKIEISIMKGANLDVPNLVIVDATLWIRKVRINPSIFIAHAKSLNVHTA